MQTIYSEGYSAIWEMWAEAFNNRGNAYYRKGEFELAVKDLGDAIVLDPELALAYVGRVLALTQLAQDAQAQEDLERAVELGIDRTTLEGLVEDLQTQR